ncbi:MAG: alpha/beta hydrolase [Alphaproteobacteria bacterium]|nr:alpha/beta hydrolase [Alphaproteobacteria bacterium]
MSLENRLISWALRRWIKPLSLREQSIAESRALTSRVPWGAKLARGWHIRAAGNGEWIEPVATDHPARRRHILYLHGGGFTTMSARTHRALTSRLAVWSGASLFALDYRLAPEHRFPAALEDAVTAYHDVIAAGAAPSRIAVAGDSAGGGLALALLVALRDQGDELPAAAVLFSPWTDLAGTGATLASNDTADIMHFGSWVAQQGRHYLGDTPPTHPLASPVYADLSGLPPLLIQVGDSEVLLDDSRRVFENAKAVGIDAILRIWPSVAHGWQLFAPILPEGRAALREASAFIASRLTAVGPRNLQSDQLLTLTAGPGRRS